MRYQKYSLLINNMLISKQNIYDKSNISFLKTIDISAGHFKFNNLYTEHALIMLNITGQVPLIQFFKHGKRLKQTVLLQASINKNNVWYCLDKIVNIVLPSTEDLRSFSLKKPFKSGSSYLWRLRKFFDWEDVYGLISDRLLKKDVFLPFYFNFTFSSKKKHKYNESYLRMLRMPFIFYKKSNNEKI